MEGVGEGDEDDGEPEDVESNTESFSMPKRASEYDPTADYKIVEVDVSSFTDLEAKNGKKYTVYNVETLNRRGEHSVLQKRFNEFSSLRSALLLTNPSISDLEFPKKTMLKDKVNTKERRRKAFDVFLKAVLRDCDCFKVQQWLWDAGQDHADAKVFGKDKGVRAFRDKPQRVPHPTDFESIFDLMKRPTPVLKFGRRGQPHWRVFELAQDETKITYQGSKKRQADLAGYTIASMRSIKLGQHSTSFQRSTLRQLDNVSMTIRYINPNQFGKEDSLDLVLRHPDELRIWLLGLRELMRRHSEKTGDTWGGSDSPVSGAQEQWAQLEKGVSPVQRGTSTPERLSSISSVSPGGPSSAGGGGSNESSPNAARFRMAKSGSLASQVTDWNSRASISARDLDLYDDETLPEGGLGVDHSITSICQLYTWGPNNWGQLGVDSELSSAAQADPVTTLTPVTGCTAPLNDVCFTDVGGDFTVAVRRFYPPANNTLMPEFQRAWACGRALATTDAIGGNWRERDHTFTPEPIQGLPPYIPIHSVACGESHMLILTFDGEVYASGSNFYGQLGQGTNGEGIAPCVKIQELEQVRMIAAGETISAAITEVGPQQTRLFTWGGGAHGALGHDNDEDVYTPKVVEAVDNDNIIKQQIVCGGSHMALLGIDNTPPEPHGRQRAMTVSKLQMNDDDRTAMCLWTWGCGMLGQLGHNSFEDCYVPKYVEMLGSKVVRQVACGAAHTVAIVDVRSGPRLLRGQLWTWGAGLASTGTPSAPCPLPRFFNFTKTGHQNNVAEQVACGDHFTAVLDEDGKITIIGLSPITGKQTNEQLDLPADFNNEDVNHDFKDIEAIAAGGRNLAVIVAHRHAPVTESLLG